MGGEGNGGGRVRVGEGMGGSRATQWRREEEGKKKNGRGTMGGGMTGEEDDGEGLWFRRGGGWGSTGAEDMVDGD